MEILDIEQLAGYLSRDVREVGKLANRGVLPGRKVNGEWRFARAEINHWLSNRVHEYTSEELAALESAHAGDVDEPLLANLMSVHLVAVPLKASTRSSVLRELVKLSSRPGKSTTLKPSMPLWFSARKWAARPCHPAWPSLTLIGPWETASWAIRWSRLAERRARFRSAGRVAA